MNTNKFIRELAKKYGKDERVIRSIVNSPFVFAKRTMMSLDDDRPIRIPLWGMFVPRYKMGKYFTKLMILTHAIKNLMDIYKAKDSTELEKQSAILASNMIIDILKKEGYENEQSVQYIIKWKSRVESGLSGDPSIQSDMGERQVQDEGSSNDGD